MDCLCGRLSVWVSSWFEYVCVNKNFIHIPAIFSAFSISFLFFRLLHFLFHFTTNLFVFTFVIYIIFLSVSWLFFSYHYFFFNINAFVLYFFVFFSWILFCNNDFCVWRSKPLHLFRSVAVGSLQLKLCLSFLYNQSYICMQCYGLIL